MKACGWSTFGGSLLSCFLQQGVDDGDVPGYLYKSVTLAGSSLCILLMVNEFFHQYAI